MYNMLQTEIYRDLFDFRRDFEDIFSRLVTEWPIVTEPKLLKAAFTPPVEAWTDRDAKKFYLRVALPGIDPKEVKLEVQGDMLTITGEHKIVETKKEVNYLHHEFAYGRFERVLPLPEGVDAEKVTAEFNHGVLEINAPLETAVLPRHIEIKPVLRKAA